MRPAADGSPDFEDARAHAEEPRYLDGARIPEDHPLRALKWMADEALRGLWRKFESLYSTTGRPSIPPEQLLRALVLQALYSVRSERLLVEQLAYNLLSDAVSAACSGFGTDGSPGSSGSCP